MAQHARSLPGLPYRLVYKYEAFGEFELDLPAGRCTMALTVLDPAGHLPSLRFATRQYFKGGRHPVGIVAVNRGSGGSLPEDIVFDDPAENDNLH